MSTSTPRDGRPDTTEPDIWRVGYVAPPADVTVVHHLLEQVWNASPDLPPMERMRFETAFVELAGNVFEHAAATQDVRGAIEVRTSDGELRGTITDSGDPADVDLSTGCMPDELSESGRGLALIEMLVDELTYAREGDRNRWDIVRRL